jgi:restriction endonuclease S subunit
MGEKLRNPDFKPLEFDRFRRESGNNYFVLSSQRWIESTNTIGFISKSGRYGGDKNYFDILGSGLILFEGIKDYLSTSSVNGLQVEYVEQEISYRRRPSRANIQPIPNSVWFAKMKNTIKVLMADTYLCKQAVLLTGFCGIHSEQVSSSYLKQIILSKEFNDQKDQFAEGRTQEAVSTSKVKLIRLGFSPSQDEQTKIAEVLSTVDRLIGQTELLAERYGGCKLMIHDKNPPEPAEFLFYQTEDGQKRLEMAFRGETC